MNPLPPGYDWGYTFGNLDGGTDYNVTYSGTNGGGTTTNTYYIHTQS
jgi:hypothetical protein